MSVPFAKNNLAVTDGILEMYNENTGNFIKQSDSTTLKYRLLDNDPNEQSQLVGLKATAFLIKKEAKSEVVAYQSEAVIDSQNVAHFKITKSLPVGSYRVEISVVVDDQTIQIFPSKSDDPDAHLTITPSAVGLEVGSTPDTFDVKVIHRIIEDIMEKKSFPDKKKDLVTREDLEKIELTPGPKGDPGKDGTSVSVVSTSKDNGITTVAFSDGKSIQIADGSKGDSLTISSQTTLENGDKKLAFSDGTVVTIPRGPQGDNGINSNLIIVTESEYEFFSKKDDMYYLVIKEES